jgi:SSS family solute:Na+ symporter
MYIISKIETNRGVVAKGLEIDRSMFKPHPSFLVGMLIVFGILAAFYTIYW